MLPPLGSLGFTASSETSLLGGRGCASKSRLTFYLFASSLILDEMLMLSQTTRSLEKGRSDRYLGLTPLVFILAPGGDAVLGWHMDKSGEGLRELMDRDVEEAGELSQELCKPAPECINFSWNPDSTALGKRYSGSLNLSVLICKMGRSW